MTPYRLPERCRSKSLAIYYVVHVVTGGTYTRLMNVPMRTTPMVLSIDGSIGGDARESPGVESGDASEAFSGIGDAARREGGQQ